MSFDLMVFQKTESIKNFDDFLNWKDGQISWEEDRDYNSLDGTAPKLAAWFMDMKESFPPLNGPYSPSDDEAFADDDSERHLTDYSIGSSIIYGAFAWSVADEAHEKALVLAKKHSVGFFNFQTGEICCDGMIVCKLRTETISDTTVCWEQLEKHVLALDEYEGTFITVWFENNGTDEQFMQCMPIHPKKDGFIKKLFSSSKDTGAKAPFFSVEASTGEKIYTIDINEKEQAVKIFNDYYVSRRLPDTTDWEDSGII